ncbi:MAG: dTDP-4-dehydrorhamnose 3,5-epimerase [Nitrososphaerota archaeon]|nr:dTDP-4-dehydrorhamnose 3,5-epimerase [Nitrososphaerota archaeon]
MPFKFRPLAVKGVYLIEPEIFRDKRGFFMETFKTLDFGREGIEFTPVQGNHSKSARGVLRGLHFQTEPHSQSKLVRALHGSIFDVAVDIRKSSLQFGRWVGVVLSAENRHMLFVPRGFAHGFLSLEDGTEVEYLVDSEYHKESERGVKWNDPKIGVEWPIKSPTLSEKDTKWPALDRADIFP